MTTALRTRWYQRGGEWHVMVMQDSCEIGRAEDIIEMCADDIDTIANDLARRRELEAPMHLNLLHPELSDEDRLPPPWWLPALALGVTLAAAIAVCLLCARCDASVFRTHAEAALRDPDLPDYKRDLFSAALKRGATEQPCHVSRVHPREAGAAWEDWAGTRSGTLLRPGVASCTLKHWDEWHGAYLWFKGYGIAHVEDCFPEGKSRTWFDLAMEGPPWEYGDWLASRWLGTVARRFGKRPSTFVVLKLREGP